MRKLLADTSISNNPKILEELKKAGWKTTTAYRQEKGTRCYQFGVLYRFENSSVIEPPNHSICVTDKQVTHYATEKTAENKAFEAGSNLTMGNPSSRFEPQYSDIAFSFSALPSIKNMLSNEFSITIALDTEYVTVPDNNELSREIITWQFAFWNPDNIEQIVEVIFYSLNGNRLPLSFALSWMIENFHLTNYPLVSLSEKGIDYRETQRWISHSRKSGKGSHNYTRQIYSTSKEAIECCDNPAEKEALLNCNLNRQDKNYNPSDQSAWCLGYYNSFGDSDKSAIPVTLICHSNKADFTSFDLTEWNFLHKLKDIQGGMLSLKPQYIHPRTCSWHWRFYPIQISFRDTLCYAPPKKKKLEHLGNIVNIHKHEISKKELADMSSFLLSNPVKYMEYAITDSIIVLQYSTALWGQNQTMPLTVSSAAVRSAVPQLSKALNVLPDNANDFDRKFRGLTRISHGRQLIINKYNKPSYIEDTSLVPLNDDCRILHEYAKNAYHGGYNGSSIIGYYDKVTTYDYDLINAYPTCMCLVPDVDWCNSVVIQREIYNRPIILQDFRTPFDPMFGYIRFRFPESVKYPCIPVSMEGCLIFPQSSEGLDGVYASGPEIYLALRLGAEITAVRVYVGTVLVDDDLQISHSLYHTVKQLVVDRKCVQDTIGKGTIPDFLLKTAVTSLYGKTAQDVVEKSSWDAYKEIMQNIGGSRITSPVHACLTTAGVRSCLIAAMNQLNTLDYNCFSVTTDGFISDAPSEVVYRLNLFGFARLFQEARLKLTDNRSSDIWQLKHQQSDLLNITTRGNVSLAPDGVCAHNSYSTGYTPDSYEDRLAFMTKVLSRTGPLSCTTKKFTGFRDLAKNNDAKDFSATNITRSIRMDFDLKRLPDQQTFHTVYPVINETTYEIANFETRPYTSIEQYRKYKSIGKSCVVLRTENDWSVFFRKSYAKKGGSEHHIADRDAYAFRQLFTIVMGYRLRMWDIPYLSNNKLSVDQVLDWINKFNPSARVFKKSDWKNARNATRAAQMLTMQEVSDLFTKMQCIML